jgi:capsular exopolysaccharide synthesis family protein
LIFGIIAVFLREALDETVRTPRDLGELPRSVMLAHIPTDKQPGLLGTGASESRLIEFPTSPFSEAFRSLRTSILSSEGNKRVQKLLVTSAIAGDGKTTVVYNLGIALAQQGARVLIIDCDMRHPDLHTRFNVPRSPGLSDLISDDTRLDLSAIVSHTRLPMLSFLPSGEQPELAAELLGSSRFGALLQTCASQYDYVLIDSPPILPVTDAAIIANKVDGVIAVVRSRRTTRALLSGLVNALHRTQTPVLGFVLNDVRHSPAEGMYGYSYAGDRGGEIHANA